MNFLKHFFFVALIAVIFTACDKNEVAFTGDQEVEQVLAFDESSSSVSNMRSIQTRSGGWDRVSNTVKNRYYQAYKDASDGNHYPNVENAPLAVGFFTAFNATYGENYRNDLGSVELDYCVKKYPDLTYFRGFSYDKDGKTLFKSRVKEAMEEDALVAVYARTKWKHDHDILIIWAASDDEVRVTRISDKPSESFGNNYIITLTYDEIMKKGVDISKNNVVNVAFMHPERD